jgi:hypothetical protein
VAKVVEGEAWSVEGEMDTETGDHYWISGPRRDGEDALYVTQVAPEIDDDVREEYFPKIRGMKDWAE